MYKIIGADQKEYGPVSAEDLRRWMAEGRVNAQTMVQAEGQTDWRPLSSYPELTGTMPGAPTGTPPLPYAMPTTPAVDVQSRVSGPATGLMVVGILLAVASAIAIVSRLVGFAPAANTQNMPPWLAEVVRSMREPIGLVSNVIGLSLGLFYIFAATKLRKLQSYGVVITATILAMLPCTSSCCCLIGLPVGIWILAVLSKPEVKAAFH